MENGEESQGVLSDTRKSQLQPFIKGKAIINDLYRLFATRMMKATIFNSLTFSFPYARTSGTWEAVCLSSKLVSDCGFLEAVTCFPFAIKNL